MHVAKGCGGCQFQHITLDGQRGIKRDIVVDSLRRIAKIDAEVAAAIVGEPIALPGVDYRTSIRLLLHEGRPAFRRAGRHDPVTVDSCLIAHPGIEVLLDATHEAEWFFGNAKEVELRIGARTGERLAWFEPTRGGVMLPDDVVVVGTKELERGTVAAIHEVVGGRRWRISAASFFQARPDGAEVLVDLVTEAVSEYGDVVDCYSGVGLFAGMLALGGARVRAVEGDMSAVRDARHNLEDLGDRVEVIAADVHTWKPDRPTGAVVADPSRHGLDTRGVATVEALDPSRIVLISCDAAALGRDVGLLVAAGYLLRSVTPVDLFPQTFHVETVSVLDRA